MARPSLNIIHWNCRGARNKIPEIQNIATNAHIICLQETLITATNQLYIPGFNHVALISRPPGIRGLSIFIRDDFQFSTMDCNTFATPSVEVLGIRLYCPLNEPLYIFNLYRHPGSNTPFSFYRNLFGLSSLYKYIIFLGDFNAHHFDWHDSRVDSQGDSISRVCEALGLVIMNDSSPTFLSSLNLASTVIDLTIASRTLALISDTETIQDSHGSDHLPIKITMRNTCPSYFRYSYKLRLSAVQSSLFQTRLLQSAPSIERELSSQPVLTPIQKYEHFCELFRGILSSIFDASYPSPRRSRITRVRTPAPWWNNKCAEATEHRRVMCRVYKSNPTWDNWKEYKSSISSCQKILKREKKAGWRGLCSSFLHKTPKSGAS